jgi:FkbM family methyltransferase
VKLSRILIVVAALLGVVVAAYSYYPPFRLMTLAAAGRSPVCPFAKAVLCDDHAKQLEAAHNRLVKAMVKLEHDNAGFDRWKTPVGIYWIPSGDRFVLPFNLAEQELKIYGTGEQDVHTGDVVLDCGANVGVFTREALDHGASKIVAIEPAPENLEAYRRNFKDEIAAGRVIVYPKGVWDKDDVLTLHVDANNTAADTFVIQRKETTGDIQVPLTTIDKLVAELKLDRVDYIKMDIEGAEPNALRGAHDTLAKWKPRISISAYHQPDHPVVIPKIILEARPDYKMECGPCAEANGHIRPDVLYFR